jgi:DNA polymerase-3 subunit alpha
MYAPVHLHTHFSTLDGCIKISELINHLTELGLSTCAITDHGTLAGIIDFYFKCKEKNIKPLLGMEAYITDDPDNSEEKTRDNRHLVLIAKNNTGLENLIWLSTQSHLHNFYYKPRIWRQHLRDHSEGLIATSACLANYHSRQLRWEPSIGKAFIDDYASYIYLIHWFKGVFRGEYYLEVQDHDFWEQREYNRIIIDVARKEKIPLVISSDAHYLKKEDVYLHEMMMAMQFKQTLDEYRQGDNMKYGGTNYVLSDKEMCAAAKKWGIEDALDNTVRIAEQCHVSIEKGDFKIPVFDVEEASDYEEFKKWRAERKTNETDS